MPYRRRFKSAITPDERRAIWALHRLGMENSRIGSCLGLSGTAVAAHLESVSAQALPIATAADPLQQLAALTALELDFLPKPQQDSIHAALADNGRCCSLWLHLQDLITSPS